MGQENVLRKLVEFIPFFCQITFDFANQRSEKFQTKALHVAIQVALLFENRKKNLGNVRLPDIFLGHIAKIDFPHSQNHFFEGSLS